MRQWARGGAFDLLAIGLEFAAVARAGNYVGFRLPLRDATQMGADGGDGEEAAGGTHDVNLLVLQDSDGIDGIEIGSAGAKCGGRLEQDVRREILVGERGAAEAGDAQRAHGDFAEKVAARHFRWARRTVRRIGRGSRFGVTHGRSTISSTGMKLGSSSKTSKASMEMVWAGQRSAQRPQRTQMVSSLTMTEPSNWLSSSGATCCRSIERSSCSLRRRSLSSSVNAKLFSGTRERQFSGQTSTQPPQRMHSVPVASVPSKIVLIQQRRQRLASLRAWASV